MKTAGSMASKEGRDEATACHAGHWQQMKTKLKTFDAGASSRQWREDTGRRLDAMSIEERLAFLNNLKQRHVATGVATASCVVGEDVVSYRTKNHTKP
jgi:hypothetical protein